MKKGFYCVNCIHYKDEVCVNKNNITNDETSNITGNRSITYASNIYSVREFKCKGEWFSPKLFYKIVNSIFGKK